MKLDLLVFSSHPDDAELGCSGTILSLRAAGKTAGIIDLTEGELGTRGSVADRYEESAASSKVLDIQVRENLKLPDGFLKEDKESLLRVIVAIRKYQPDLILCNAVSDRHPDHGDGGSIVSRATFLSGLARIETSVDGNIQNAWRPKNLYHYIQDRYIKPDFVVDISETWNKKTEAIRCYKSQFFNPSLEGPQTYISTPEFMKFIEARAIEFGHSIGVRYGEGFVSDRGRYIGVKDIFSLI